MEAIQVVGRGVPVVSILRWVARLWALGMFLLWGAFFVEHLEWFANPRQWPPAYVITLSLLHLLFLIGLAVGWRWELPGAVLVLIAAPVFFGFAAGFRALPFTAITIAPALLWLLCLWLEPAPKPPGGPWGAFR